MAAYFALRVTLTPLKKIGSEGSQELERSLVETRDNGLQ